MNDYCPLGTVIGIFDPETDVTILVPALDRCPEHVREPEESGAEEHEPRREAVVESEADIVDLDRVVLAGLEEATKAKNCVE